MGGTRYQDTNDAQIPTAALPPLPPYALYVQCELEVVSLEHLDLLHHDLYAGVNGDSSKSYDKAACASDDALMLTGLNEVLQVKVLSWSERVQSMVDNGQWIEALALALDFFEGCAKAAIGLVKEGMGKGAALPLPCVG